MANSIKYEIKAHLGVLAEKNSGWKKEVNIVSWNGAEPKFDVREWSPEHDKMGKGVTLTEDEAKNLVEVLGSAVK